MGAGTKAGGNNLNEIGIVPPRRILFMIMQGMDLK